MTRLSRTLLPTLKDPPADAEAVSHKLLVRAGMIRQVGAGLWTYLPAGLRSHRKAEQIIREEMNRIGGQEISMPILQPADAWQKTGRYGIEEMFKLEDRKGSPMVLAMTAEECVTGHVSREVRSYRDLPQLLYQIQTKERDEPRPRAGVLRTREFMMKDAYSFDRDEAGLDETYNLCIEAYDRIYDRSGLRWYRVESDVGMMGGSGAHEYMAPCGAGEDTIALASGYAANLEVASANPRPVQGGEELPAPVEVETPGLKTIEQVSGSLGLDPGALIKSVALVTDEGEFVLALIRGDHQLNEIKLANALGVQSRPAGEEEIAEKLGPAGFIGPVGASVRILKDRAVTGGGLVAGANRPDLHLKGVEPGRDFAFEEVDIRTVVEGDTTDDGHSITLEPAIEIGNIFKLGTRYTEPLGATFLDENGEEKPVIMGCYGIGPARIVAAAAEQYADENGLSWPVSLAPWDIQLVSLSKSDEPERVEADRLYEELLEQGFDVLYDDRDAGPGQKLTDAELLGCPLRVVVGRRGLADGIYEVSERRSGEVHRVPVEGGAAGIAGLYAAISGSD
ncbi:MAG TPA: proline--tRNA ligase [Solirubrobacterales bacterium]|nr:proline--tRNA ligase [Solirubrobacterales bacterium]HMU26575.1 proline--tRNA ligase [Solirubrobacterales bacterium]HMX70607.1 proline--tRNA ligase [Solirubrobacterales bacterium]HMY26052.1 proline--tRNA ligase [Solirubrobacterales bacterium]HNA22882.1 proline--tRNA ligase [Solirubrobacterales bacterium]